MAKSKQIVGIDCDGAAAAAIRLVLITRFEEMCALREQALKWSDPEGVHDMRVSSRRLRGAFRDFMPYLHKRKLSPVLKKLQNLADALGAVRDEDVAIIGLQKLEAGAPPEAAAMVDKLVKAKKAIRTEARRDLRLALQKGRLKQLQKDVETALDSATTNPKRARRRSKNTRPETEITYREVARRIILERLKEVEKLSAGMYRPLKIKPLHRLRIAAKRFRYALELFEPCWGPEVSSCAKKVAALQSSLGELHDADIWIETFGRDWNGAGEQAKEQKGAALWLLNYFVRLHSKHLRSTLGKWSEWEVRELGARLRQSLQDSVLAAQSVDSVESHM